MATWLKDCEICNIGLCNEMDRLIDEKGISMREASRDLSRQAHKHFVDEGVDLENGFSPDTILSRYRYHTARINRACESHTEKKSIEVPAKNLGNSDNKPGEISYRHVGELPKCKKFGEKPVQAKWHGERLIPEKGGMCRDCRYEKEQRKIEAARAAFNAIPINEEVDVLWSNIAENLKELDPTGKDIPCVGKIRPETISKVQAAMDNIQTIINFVTEDSQF